MKCFRNIHFVLYAADWSLPTSPFPVLLYLKRKCHVYLTAQLFQSETVPTNLTTSIDEQTSIEVASWSKMKRNGENKRYPTATLNQSSHVLLNVLRCCDVCCLTRMRLNCEEEFMEDIKKI